MIFCSKCKIYHFPGGTIEKNETHIEALIRETLEETGFKIIPETIKEYGFITETGKYLKLEKTVYVQNEFYYFCDIEDRVYEKKLTEEEKDAGYELRYVTCEEAISVNKEEMKKRGDYIDIETYVLKLLIEE
jgi:8-oxo-dGTP pyrophosphatase MutT (NUDIX family)